MLSAALLFLFAPAHALDGNGLATGDTISISNGGLFLAANSTGVYATKDMSTDALWEVVRTPTDGERFRLRGLGIVGVNQYLYFSKKSYYSVAGVSSMANSSAFSTGALSAETGGWKTQISVTVSGNSYRIYAYSDGSWYGDQYGLYDADLHIEQWTRKKETSLTITCSEESLLFPFVDEKNYFAKDQNTTVTYTATQAITTYIGSLGNNTTRLEEKQGTVYPSAQPSFAWRSGTGMTSDLPATMIDNPDETYTERSRPMLTYSQKDNQVTITPQGSSPINLKEDGAYTDFRDILTATVEIDGQTATHQLSVTRIAGHYITSGLHASISPSAKLFGSNGGMRVFDESIQLVEGEKIVGKDNTVLHNGTHIYDYSTTTAVPLDDSRLTRTYRVIRNADSKPSEDVTKTGDNPLALTVNPNPRTTVREATLYADYTYTKNGKDYSAEATVHLSQSAKGAAKINFHHKPGIGDTALDSTRRYQRVHTLETTIYYDPDSQTDDICLEPNEMAFWGYWRWYNYDTDGNPKYDPDTETANEDFWKQGPMCIETKETFKAINEGQDSRGRYAASDVLNTAYVPPVNAPVINTKALNKKQYNIACDVSAYTDYIISDTAITEPTLSYRQIFHLIPATAMADSLTKCTGDTYYETHNVIVPTGTEVLLATDFKHKNADHKSDLCYFYYDGGQLKRVGVDATVQWYENGKEYYNYKTPTPTTADPNPKQTDYVAISSDTAGIVTYDARFTTSSGTVLNLARFVVTYMDKTTCGPMKEDESGKALMTQAEIENDYIPLSLKDFNYDIPGTTNVKYYYHHLSWEEATYGYTYPEGMLSYKRKVSGAFPYYGEYVIANKFTEKWATAEQHGGAENGYCLYADGTKKTGRVVSINAKTNICKGQQLYCSAWVCNGSKQKTDGAKEPSFKFVLQGRSGNGNWENIGEFLTGPIDFSDQNNKNSYDWYQVLFPVKSAKDYDESRVSIYNFATTNSGNDFMIDDVCLFVSKLPLYSYQATTTCSKDTSEIILSRIDYTTLTDEWDALYYQIYNVSKEKVLVTDYFWDTKPGAEDDPQQYGRINIPDAGYTPQKGTDSIFANLSGFIDTLKNPIDNKLIRKAYIQIDGKWMMYLGDVVNKNLIADGNDVFMVRLAFNKDDLRSPQCALHTELKVTPKSNFFFNGESTPQVGICANNIYPLNVVVSNQYVAAGSDKVQTLKAEALADWLLAYAFDSCFEKTKIDENVRDQANAAFKEAYGYDRNTINEALRSLRNPDEANTNRLVDDVTEIKPLNDAEGVAIITQPQVDIITDLVERGYLQLAKRTLQCYMTVGDTVMYWVYPILGTATAPDPNNPDKTVELNDCDEHSFMRVCAVTSGIVLNLSPEKEADKDPAMVGKIPAVRISESEVKNFHTVVTECSLGIELVSDSCKLVSTTDPVILEEMQYMDFHDNFAFSNTLDLTAGTLTIQAKEGNTYTMRPGCEYTMRVKLRTAAETEQDPNGCDAGYAFFTVKVIPDTMIWHPTVSNGRYYDWGDDRNWRALIGGKEMDYGYTPLAGKTNAVIPTLDDAAQYPCITGTNRYPLDVHYDPAGCKDIRFREGAMLLNQHLLTYNNAYVDMAIQSAAWYLLAAPLQGMYSGDLFIPHSGTYTGTWQNLESKDDFQVSGFKGTRYDNSAYIFSAAYYNREVPVIRETTQDNGYTTNTTDFRASNALNEEIIPGSGIQVLGYGPGDDGEKLVVRLPKQDKTYFYFTSEGEQDTASVELERTVSHRLAYGKTGKGTDAEMTFTLTNEEASQSFLFGNPTMAYIDMDKFLKDNQGGQDVSLVFRTMEASTWYALAPYTSDASDRMLPPMTAAMLSVENATQELKVTLKPEHLLIPETAQTASVQGMPRRRLAAGTARDAKPAVMTVWLLTPTATYTEQPYACAQAAIGLNAAAGNGYVFGEDALFTSSGIETANGQNAAAGQDADNVVVSPLNIYTVAGENTLMADVRNEIGIIPLGVVASPDVHAAFDSLELCFSLSLPWSEECYLCDNVKGSRTPIYNDTRIRIPMPADHEARYYIEGPAAPKDPDTPTSVDAPHDGMASDDISMIVRTDGRDGVAVIASAPMAYIRACDPLGRTLYTRTFDIPVMMHNFRLSDGVAVIEAVFTSGAAKHRKIYIRP